MKVILGETIKDNQKNAEKVEVVVSKIVRHPSWNRPCGSINVVPFDIAILVLEKPFDLKKYPHIKPACLLQNNEKSLVDKLALVTGRGRGSTDHLNKLVLKITSQQESQLVAVVNRPDDNHASPCRGDSGGPLITKDDDNNGAATLVGVVSGASGCDTPSDSVREVIYANVANVMPWIMEEMKQPREICPAPDQSTWYLP